MSESYTVDRQTTISCDGEGWRVGVRSDRDGLDLCSIYYSEDGAGAQDKEILLTWEAAVLLAKAILKVESDR